MEVQQGVSSISYMNFRTSIFPTLSFVLFHAVHVLVGLTIKTPPVRRFRIHEQHTETIINRLLLCI